MEKFIILKLLEDLGYKFISNSDTEVILYSYKEWGIKCIDKFIGMFAILDKLVLVRDRAGVKPLYLCSLLKSNHFISILSLKRSKILPYFFQFGYIPAPYTIFKNCFKLEAGHYMELEINSLEFEITKYWDVTDFYLQEKFTKNEDEIMQLIYEWYLMFQLEYF